MGGQDFDALKKQALTRDFKPVPLGSRRRMAIKNTLRTIDSQNVVAKLEGSDPALKDEYVVYSAHWDHLGVGEPVNGDKIYNGALDNASGVATVLEIARAFTQAQPQPKRSILFLMVTAEEQGLLGSRVLLAQPALSAGEDRRQHQHRRRQPVGTDEGHHRRRHGRVRSRRLPAGGGAGAGADAARRSRAGEGLLLPLGSLQLRQAGRAGARSRRGHRLRRQDPRDYGKKKHDEYSEDDYHAPSDQVKPDWDLQRRGRRRASCCSRSATGSRNADKLPGVEGRERIQSRSATRC